MKKILIMTCLLFSGFGLSAQLVKNFELKDVQNNQRNYNELKGKKLTLIDFWATWCKPCVKAIPEFNKLYEVYKAQGVEIIGINCDGPRSVSKVGPLSKALNMQYPVLLDINAAVKTELNILAFPTLVIVDANDRIVWIHEGYVSGDADIIREEIDKLLNQH